MHACSSMRNMYVSMYTDVMLRRRHLHSLLFFLRNLGLPDDEAKRLVSRIVAAYATRK